MRDAFGAALLDRGERDGSFLVLDADNAPATRAAAFAGRFPDRFVNVGCAEQSLVGIACGLGLAGVPVVATTFAIFLVGRAFEQIRNTLCMSDLPVTLVGTHAGITVGYDGASHFCVEDLALMRTLPGMAVLVASSDEQVPALLELAMSSRRPAYLRISRQDAPDGRVLTAPTIGGSELVRHGTDVTVVACGLMVARSLQAAGVLAAGGVQADVIDAYSVKPLDTDAIVRSAGRTGAVVCVEEHGPSGGLSDAVAGVLAGHYPVPMERVTLPDAYASSADPGDILNRYGLGVADIVRAVRRVRERAPAVGLRRV